MKTLGNDQFELKINGKKYTAFVNFKVRLTEKYLKTLLFPKFCFHVEKARLTDENENEIPLSNDLMEKIKVRLNDRIKLI